MTERSAAYSSSTIFLIGLCFIVSGATGLIYEVLWARMLGLVFGATTLAVSTVLAAFMGGLALGSALAGRLGDADQETARHVRMDGNRHRRLRPARSVPVSLDRSRVCVDLAAVSPGLLRFQSLAFPAFKPGPASADDSDGRNAARACRRLG